MPDCKYIHKWLAERNIALEPGFAESLKGLAGAYKKHGNSLTEIYAALGCSKQNISYWNIHSYSTQSKKSIYKVIHNAEELFQLSSMQAEALTNSSGLSLYHEKIGKVEDHGKYV